MADYPVLSQHFGAWEGTYALIESRTGEVLDRHQSRIEVWRDGTRYFQRNIYTWADGRQTSVEFPGELRDGKGSHGDPHMALQGQTRGAYVGGRPTRESNAPDPHLAVP